MNVHNSFTVILFAKRVNRPLFFLPARRGSGALAHIGCAAA
jgi:hypothetical protein